MSSSTTAEFRPSLPPPPVREHVEGKQVMSLSRVLGEGGRKELLATFDSLNSDAPAVLEPFCGGGDPAALKKMKQELGMNWQRSKSNAREFTIRLGEAQLPAAAREAEVSALNVTMRFGSNSAELEFDQSFIRQSNLTESQRQTVTQACRIAANRAFNQVLALTMQNSVSKMLLETQAMNISMVSRRIEVVQSARQTITVENRNVLRTEMRINNSAQIF